MQALVGAGRFRISTGAQTRANKATQKPSSAVEPSPRGEHNVCYASNTEIVPGENEPPEAVVRRFRKAVNASGLYREVRKRRFHESTQDVKKRKESEPKRPRIKPRTLADAEQDATLRGGAVPSSRRPGTIPKPKK